MPASAVPPAGTITTSGAICAATSAQPRANSAEWATSTSAVLAILTPRHLGGGAQEQGTGLRTGVPMSSGALPQVTGAALTSDPRLGVPGALGGRIGSSLHHGRRCIAFLGPFLSGPGRREPGIDHGLVLRLGLTAGDDALGGSLKDGGEGVRTQILCPGRLGRPQERGAVQQIGRASCRERGAGAGGGGGARKREGARGRR